jgi:hypothetical protein
MLKPINKANELTENLACYFCDLSDYCKSCDALDFCVLTDT